MKPCGRIEYHELCEQKQFLVQKAFMSTMEQIITEIYIHCSPVLDITIFTVCVHFGFLGYNFAPVGIEGSWWYQNRFCWYKQSKMASGKQCRVFNLNFVKTTKWHYKTYIVLSGACILLQVHTQILGTQSRFWCVWACTRFEAHDAVSKQDRFSYDYAIGSYISTPSIIFHSQIY